MKSVNAVATEVDLAPFKKQYAVKWAAGPNETPGTQDLVDRYLKELDSKYEDDGKEDLSQGVTLLGLLKAKR